VWFRYPGIDVSRDNLGRHVSGFVRWGSWFKNDVRFDPLCASALTTDMCSLALLSLLFSLPDIITSRGAFTYCRTEVSSSYFVPMLYALFPRTSCQVLHPSWFIDTIIQWSMLVLSTEFLSPSLFPLLLAVVPSSTCPEIKCHLSGSLLIFD
jgi:hypothetical protein